MSNTELADWLGSVAACTIMRWDTEELARLATIAQRLRVLAKLEGTASLIISCDRTCGLNAIFDDLAALSEGPA